MQGFSGKKGEGCLCESEEKSTWIRATRLVEPVCFFHILASTALCYIVDQACTPKSPCGNIISFVAVWKDPA